MNPKKRTIQVEWMETPDADITDADVASSVRQMLHLAYGDVIANLGVDVSPAVAPVADRFGWSTTSTPQPRETALRFPVVMTQDEAEQLARGLRQLADEVAAHKPRTAALYVDRDEHGNPVRWAAEVLWVSDHEI